nr:hypothetical protein Itr_chr11CG09950 [Ipomoea trifida]GMD49899.1 hypothetical protein Iba_chr11aCG7460 [Ipomoea batatas]GMD54076.1 hypothetical protein Iba_chr11cCG8680 [Ipomoea batatas]GMD55397.1 hypothetical protein Iba_chr11dCG7540 [Ipomoea batatas]GMD58793.1 hypothetical protein Iba_chr11fCG9000 [Ipomoea batatas]
MHEHVSAHGYVSKRMTRGDLSCSHGKRRKATPHMITTSPANLVPTSPPWDSPSCRRGPDNLMRFR